MKLPLRRSTGMEQTLTAPASEIPSDEDAAFEALYREARDDVFAYASGLLRDRSAAEEVTAVAFERAYRKRRRFDERRGSRRAWLFGIARNAALDELRRQKRQTGLQGDEPAARPSADVLDAPASPPSTDPLERIAVRAALDQLTPRERELVALKFFAGLSNGEIANVVGISESNSGTRVHRVVEKLRRICDEAE
jgi:RNA polymerase sigma-70 factor (ECF subfamily)